MSKNEKFPQYKRSPRLILEVPEKEIEIKKPAHKATISKTNLTQIIVIPMVMLIITLAMGILLKRGIYMFVFAASTVLTMVFSIIRYVSERKECNEVNMIREQLYSDYLLEKRKEIFLLRSEENQAHQYNYPAVQEIKWMIEEYSERIYEKSYRDDDFLSLNLGFEKTKSKSNIKVNFDELEVKKDELDMEAKSIHDEFLLINKKPVVIDLKKANLGLVGRREIIHEQIKIIIAQLTFFQSYHDLELISLFSEADKDEFEYLRWYPHCQIHSLNVTGNITTNAVGEQVLGSLHQLLRERKNKFEESKNKEKFLPHFLFIIDEPKLIMDHAIMEFLCEEEEKRLGFSIIYTSTLQANLPDTIGTILQYSNEDSGRLIIDEKRVINKDIQLDRIGDVQVEWLARDLSVLIHEQGMVVSLPDSITFFEMYNISNPTELNISSRWRDNETHKTLGVPIGIRVTGDLLYLNLHEKAHGPHGLVAGTTGSGKSEILQSYILSLAVNFHPHEVGFLLIDYKGGGMANLFEHLPHLLGTITNLDAEAGMRALASIRSELSRRQRIFLECNVNHINAYNRMFKAGEVNEPIPHLFIISDEFAELKKEQPEFMTELVSTARLGRSLGIHLILATQKPSGVVTDQIWTNSKFKLALKVQDEADSRDVIKTSDAAYIVQPGRAYLQVGNNEIYELFQSAYSGADCYEEEEIDSVDNRVYRMNILGQAELLNQDLSIKDSNKNSITQLDAVIQHIDEIYENMEVVSVKKPWLPPLVEQMISPYISEELVIDIHSNKVLDLTIAIGMMDIPQEQSQKEYIHSFAEDGNFAVFSAAGFGKSTLIMTMLMTLAIKNSAELLNYFILDMGNASLLPLRELPHTADYMTFDDGAKLSKFCQMISEEMKIRKRLFANVGAISFEMYNRISEQKMPAIIWVIDNYDLNKEMDQELDSYIIQVARDGNNLGIYILLAASRSGVMRFSLLSSIKNKIALYMYDKTELNTVVGRTKYDLKEVKGRGLVKTEDVNIIQIYSSYSMKSDDEYVDGVKRIVNGINDVYTGNRPKAIKMMPNELNKDILDNYVDENAGSNLIPIGLDLDDVNCQYIDLLKGRQLLVGSTASGRTNLLKLILSNRNDSIKTYIVDDKSLELYSFRDKKSVDYIHNLDGVKMFLEEMRSLIEERQLAFIKEQELNPSMLPKLFFASLPSVLVVVAEWEEFMSLVTDTKDLSAEKIIIAASEVNIVFLAAANCNRLKAYDLATKHMKESIFGIVTGSFSAQTIFSSTVRTRNDNSSGTGYIIENSVIRRIQIAKVD